jgi:hypothetical protein
MWISQAVSHPCACGYPCVVQGKKRELEAASGPSKKKIKLTKADLEKVWTVKKPGSKFSINVSIESAEEDGVKLNTGAVVPVGKDETAIEAVDAAHELDPESLLGDA